MGTNYDNGKRTPVAIAALEYGSKLRAIRCIKVSTGKNYTEAFVKDELDMIEVICDEAEQRAKAEFESVKMNQSETSSD